MPVGILQLGAKILSNLIVSHVYLCDILPFPLRDPDALMTSQVHSFTRKNFGLQRNPLLQSFQVQFTYTITSVLADHALNDHPFFLIKLNKKSFLRKIAVSTLAIWNGCKDDLVA